MTFDQAYTILGLDRTTTDRKALRQAYARLGKLHRPDSDPQGFAKIRDAYERLLEHVPEVLDAVLPASETTQADQAQDQSEPWTVPSSVLEAIEASAASVPQSEQLETSSAEHDAHRQQRQAFHTALDAFEQVLIDTQDQGEVAARAAQLRALDELLALPAWEQIDVREQAALRLGWMVLEYGEHCGETFLDHVLQSVDFENYEGAHHYGNHSLSLRERLQGRLKKQSEWAQLEYQAKTPKTAEHLLFHGGSFWAFARQWVLDIDHRAELRRLWTVISQQYPSKVPLLNATTLWRMQHWPDMPAEVLALLLGLLAMALPVDISKALATSSLPGIAKIVVFVSGVLAFAALFLFVFALAQYAWWKSKQALKNYAAPQYDTQGKAQPTSGLQRAAQGFGRKQSALKIEAVLFLTLLVSLPWVGYYKSPSLLETVVWVFVLCILVSWLAVANLAQQLLATRWKQLSWKPMTYLLWIAAAGVIGLALKQDWWLLVVGYLLIFLRSHLPGWVSTHIGNANGFLHIRSLGVSVQMRKLAMGFTLVTFAWVACLNALANAEASGAVLRAVFPVSAGLFFVWLTLHQHNGYPKMNFVHGVGLIFMFMPLAVISGTVFSKAYTFESFISSCLFGAVGWFWLEDFEVKRMMRKQ